MQAAQARRQKELEEKKAKMKRLAVSWEQEVADDGLALQLVTATRSPVSFLY
jgi:hypothetical protein